MELPSKIDFEYHQTSVQRHTSHGIRHFCCQNQRQARCSDIRALGYGPALLICW
jgi:hypothetical protein